MPDITPDLQREIEETAKLLSTKFAQPEFIPGCEVKSITDINLYATNNGWIEAVCGQHNQQRVRWKSSETVAVNDFVDVLYFPDRRVFEIYGIGGSTAIIAPGGGWPFDNVLTVSTTDPDAEYATLPLAIAAAVAGDVISLDAETYSLTAMETLADIGLTIEGKGPGATIITSSITNSTAFFINAANITFRNCTVRHTGAGSASGCFQVNANNFTLDNVSVEKTSGAPTTGYGVWAYAGTGHRFYNGTKIVCSSGTTKYGIQNSLATITLTIEGGSVQGDTFDIFGDQAGSVITLIDPILINGSKSFTGTLRGEAFDQYGRRLRVKPIGVNDGRLTLTTALPVTTADVTAATTIYYTPYIGGKCEVYNGSFWVEAPFTELSLSLSGFTADKNSDLWIYDNAGTLALERTEWTNDTTRATALAYQDGRLCKSGTLTRLYLGTFRTTATTGQCEDSAIKRFCWNNYNRVNRYLPVTYISSHTYAVATWRPWNNSQVNSQVEMVVGEATQALGIYRAYSPAGTPAVAFALNTTTSPSGGVKGEQFNNAADAASSDLFILAAGYNFWVAIQHGGTSATYDRISMTMQIEG